MIDGIETQPHHLLYLPIGRQVSLNSGLCHLVLAHPGVSGLNVSVPRIKSGTGLAHSFALLLPSDPTSQ